MVMKNPLRSGIVALIAVVFCTANSWAARSSGARLTIADNKVTIAGQPAASGTAITPGDTIVTGSRSRAELMLPDGTVVRIGQGSSFTYTGSKLVLNQGTALVHVTHKNTTVISGSRTYTGGPAVVSAEVSKKTDGLYILQGGGKVNGVTLIPGQTSVLDRGKDRTFTFDLQKMEASSALVTKFPQTPWIVQTETLGAVQHQLLTAKVTPAGKSRPQGGSQDNVSGSLASLVSTGAAGTSLASRTGSSNSPGGGALQLLGGPLSLGADKVAVIKSAAISSFTNGGTLQVSVSGAVINVGTSAMAIRTLLGGSVTLNNNASSGGTLSSTGGTLNIGGAGNVVATNAAIFDLNTTISGVSMSNSLIGITKTGAGTLVLNGTNTFTGGTNVAAGTLTVNNGAVIAGNTGAITLINPNLTFANSGTTSVRQNVNGGTLTVNNGAFLTGSNNLLVNTTGNAGTLAVINGGVINLNGVQTTVVPGQTLTIGGVNYTATLSPLVNGGFILQPAAH